jgi:hypothetical protein
MLRCVIGQSTDADAGSARTCLSNELIFGLLELFNTPDPRERDYLKTIVHHIYMKIPAARRFIRESIGNIFSTYLEASAINSTLQKQHRGIPELLELVTSIIDGLQVPVKEEHWQYFEMQLLPLHRDSGLGTYQQQLHQCVGTFLLKVRCTHAQMHSMHPYTHHASKHQSTHALMHPCTHHAPKHPCTKALIHPCTHTPMRPCTHALMHSMHPCTHAPMHP